mgnify:FL=1
MPVLNIYIKDLETARLLIARDHDTTLDFFYGDCYPLFFSIFSNYYTDCKSCLEFINEIYLLLLSPSASNGHCQMENFRGESTLKSWIKSACLFYCYSRYKRKKNLITTDSLKNDVQSIDIDSVNVNRNDVERLLRLMPNPRYRQLIRLRYLEQKSNEETAACLGMTMANYYNKHKLAKQQYMKIYKKEAQHE